VRYQINHLTTYTYDRPVLLGPHVVRLRPRCDVTQKLHQFLLQVDPAPLHSGESVDLEGNATLQLWFSPEATTTFRLQTLSQVETFRDNPFNFLLAPGATRLPIDYSHTLYQQLQPYWVGPLGTAIDPVAMQLAQEIWCATAGDTLSFLSELNQRIYQTCQYTFREQGEPLPPGITWQQKSGSCRDVTVLFMEVCRAIGIAARFVSGYQEGDLDSDDRHLHAWVEVYLPGAGWRGYDPTHGLAVADGHIALVASTNFRNTMPVSGALKTEGGVRSKVSYQLLIQRL
jgi:transglutaminase-like putative cysteine protease